MHRLLFNGNNTEFRNAFPPFHPAVFAATAISTLALVATALFWRAGDARRATFADLLIASLSFTLAAPIVWGHHYGVTLPIFAVALPMIMAAPWKRTGPLLLLAVAYLLISHDFRFLGAFADGRANVLQSYVFAGGLMLLALLYWLRRTIATGKTNVQAAAL